RSAGAPVGRRDPPRPPARLVRRPADEPALAPVRGAHGRPVRADDDVRGHGHGRNRALGEREVGGLVMSDKLAELLGAEVVTRAHVRDVTLPSGAGRLARITVDTGRDHARPNALGRNGLAELNAALDKVAARDDIAAVGVTGKPFVFAVGADLNGVPLIRTREDALAIARLGHDVFRRLGELDVPSFAYYNGAARSEGRRVGE